MVKFGRKLMGKKVHFIIQRHMRTSMKLSYQRQNVAKPRMGWLKQPAILWKPTTCYCVTRGIANNKVLIMFVKSSLNSISVLKLIAKSCMDIFQYDSYHIAYKR